MQAQQNMDLVVARGSSSAAQARSTRSGVGLRGRPASCRLRCMEVCTRLGGMVFRCTASMVGLYMLVDVLRAVSGVARKGCYALAL